MRILDRIRRSTHGNTLVVTIVVTGIIGFLLASYLSLVRSQNVATMRSQAWNATIPIIEAGIEDALTHMNTQLTNDLACDQWERHGIHYCMRRYIGGHYYEVTISNWVVGATNSAPVIESRGYIDTPLMVAMADGGALLAALPPLPPMPPAPPSTRTYVVRGIRCIAKQTFLFDKPLSANGQIDLKGRNISSDSFDSSDPAGSSNGLYDVNFRRDKGDIATNSGLTNSINSGNAQIYGKLSTGPGGGVKIGPQGRVGSEAFHELPNSEGKAEAGWIRDDMNVDFPPVKPPYTTGGFGLTGGTYPPGSGPFYTYVLGDQRYSHIGDLNINGTMLVTNHSCLYVTGNLTISGGGSIRILPGASLTVYVQGMTTTIGGNGVANETGIAENFQYYGLPSNRGIDFQGNADFIGTVYAPSAHLSIGGGGHDEYDFTGAAVVNSVEMNGHYAFHFDEALNKYGPPKGYVVSRWDEMTAEEVADKPVTF